MTYNRSRTLDLSVPLSREELKVFTSVRGETSLDAVVVKTRLDANVVEAVIERLLARELLVRTEGETSGRSPLQPAPQPSTAHAPETSTSWLAQRRAVEAFLLSAVDGERAGIYVAQLQDCADEKMFVETTRSIARRLELIVDTGVSEQLLTHLES